MSKREGKRQTTVDVDLDEEVVEVERIDVAIRLEETYVCRSRTSSDW